MSETPDDGVLVLKLRQQDQVAWELLIERFGSRLHTYIRYQVGHSSEADDIFQETLIAAVRSFSSYSEQAQLYSWLVGIARHKIIDHWRRNKPADSLPLHLAAPSPAESTGLYEALTALSDEYHRVIKLHYLDGFSVGEVATQIGRSYKATESLLTRARERLRNQLREQ